MAKQGMHENDHNDQDVSRGQNKLDKSVEVTTGDYKKAETYAKQAREQKNTGKAAQHGNNEWLEDTHQEPSKKDLVGDQ